MFRVPGPPLVVPWQILSNKWYNFPTIRFQNPGPKAPFLEWLIGPLESYLCDSIFILFCDTVSIDSIRLLEGPLGHLGAPKTNYMSNFNRLITTRLFLDRAHQHPKLLPRNLPLNLRQNSINFMVLILLLRFDTDYQLAVFYSPRVHPHGLPSETKFQVLVTTFRSKTGPKLPQDWMLDLYIKLLRTSQNGPPSLCDCHQIWYTGSLDQDINVKFEDGLCGSYRDP